MYICILYNRRRIKNLNVLSPDLFRQCKQPLLQLLRRKVLSECMIALSGKSASQVQAFEQRVDQLECRLKDKMEVDAGFADVEVRKRKLIAQFKYFDTNNSGEIDYQEFFAAMTKLNFVGCQKEMEGLFNRYDDDASGTIGYAEFASHLFGLSEKLQMDGKAKDIIERVKNAIVQSGGVSGIHGVTRLLRRMDIDGSGTLDKAEFMEGLKAFGITDIPATDMQKLFSYFDRSGKGVIGVEDFLRGIKTGMSYDRKVLVRQAFNCLDKTGRGLITIDNILTLYDFSSHPDVNSGLKTKSDIAEEILGHFHRADAPGATVTWAEFLDYYRGISIGIDDDAYFELMMRNAWHMSGGSGAAENSACRRVLVIHKDGSQEVVEIKDDLGLGKFDVPAITKRLQQQGVKDIATIKI